MAKSVYDDDPVATPDYASTGTVTIERREVIANLTYDRYGRGPGILEVAFNTIAAYIAENSTPAGMRVEFDLDNQTYSVEVSPATK